MLCFSTVSVPLKSKQSWLIINIILQMCFVDRDDIGIIKVRDDILTFDTIVICPPINTPIQYT